MFLDDVVKKSIPIDNYFLTYGEKGLFLSGNHPLSSLPEQITVKDTKGNKESKEESVVVSDQASKRNQKDLKLQLKIN